MLTTKHHSGIDSAYDLFDNRSESVAYCTTCDWRGTPGEYLAAAGELIEHRHGWVA